MANPLAPISVNQQKQYGDSKALEDTAKAVKPGSVSGALMPARKAGRPVQSGQTAQPQGGGAFSVPPEHEQLATKVAQAQTIRDFWAQVSQTYPSRWARMYASAAQKDLERTAMEARSQTPWFED